MSGQLGPNPGGRCLCGCGEKTNLAPYNKTSKGYVKGQPDGMPPTAPKVGAA